MPLSSEHFTIGLTRAQIASADNMPHKVVIHNNNNDSAHTLFLGDDTVTTSTGLHLDGKQTITLNVGPNDTLYAVSNHDGTVASVLDIRWED